MRRGSAEVTEDMGGVIDSTRFQAETAGPTDGSGTASVFPNISDRFRSERDRASGIGS